MQSHNLKINSQFDNISEENLIIVAQVQWFFENIFEDAFIIRSRTHSGKKCRYTVNSP